MWRAIALVLAIALAGALVPAVRHLRETPPPAPRAIRTAFTVPPGVEPGAADDLLDAAISWDGRAIAFVATRDGRVQLWHRSLDATRAEPLPGTDGASLPTWRPDGLAVAFFADGALKELTLADGRIRDLARAAAPGGATWLRDGTLLFAPGAAGPIRAIRTGGERAATTLDPGDTGHLFPGPDGGDGFIYVATRSDGTRVIRRVTGEQSTDLTQTSAHGQVAANALIYVRDGALLAQRLDPAGGALTGRATVLTPTVSVSASGHGFFTASPRLIVSAFGVSGARELAWFDASGTRSGAITEPGDYWQVRLSPDDRNLAVTALDPLLRTLDVFVVPVDAPGTARRLSLSLGADSDPVWAPDGTRLLFRSLQRGTSRLVGRALAPPAAEETAVPGAESEETASDWRGHQVLFQAPSASTGLDIWVLDSTDGSRRQVTMGGFNESSAVWSPDGRTIAYVSDESSAPEIYVDAWPALGRRVRASFGGGTRPQWAPDGRTLFFIRGDEVMRSALRDTAEGVTFETPVALIDAPGLVDFAAAHRSGRFAVLTRTPGARSSVTDAITDWPGLLAGQ